MKPCRKRQVETRRGEERFKCMHKACDYNRKPVNESICDACPMRVYVEEKKRKPGALPIADHGNMVPCEFRHRSPCGMRCAVTNLAVDNEKCNRCAKDTKDATARLLDKAVNYATAMRKWAAAGMPERTDDEISQLFDDHCSRCAMFDKERGVCNSCGCPASKDQPAIRNKLKMATEACPLGQFPAKVGELGRDA